VSFSAARSKRSWARRPALRTVTNTKVAKASQPKDTMTTIQPMTSFWLAAKITATRKARTRTDMPSAPILKPPPRRAWAPAPDWMDGFWGPRLCMPPILPDTIGAPVPYAEVTPCAPEVTPCEREVTPADSDTG
jgi:hypothetical protein